MALELHCLHYTADYFQHGYGPLGMLAHHLEALNELHVTVLEAQHLGTMHSLVQANICQKYPSQLMRLIVRLLQDHLPFLCCLVNFTIELAHGDGLGVDDTHLHLLKEGTLLALCTQVCQSPS